MQNVQVVHFYLHLFLRHRRWEPVTLPAVIVVRTPAIVAAPDITATAGYAPPVAFLASTWWTMYPALGPGQPIVGHLGDRRGIAT